MKKLVVLLIVSFLVSNIYSQKRVIYGEVSFMDYPVMNVIVSAKKSNASVTTDSTGKFAIAVEPKDLIIFETKNFIQLKRRVKNQKSLKVALELKKGMINEHGVLLNNYMTPGDFQIALYKAKNDRFDYGKYSDIYDVIKAKFPTVFVTSMDYSNSNKRLIYPRGRSSIMNTAAAMLVVNGTVVDDISYLQPNDVKSIRILSSVEGVVRYGSEAKCGVVVIKTVTNK